MCLSVSVCLPHKIIVGAVAGHVLLSRCENVRLTVAGRKLVVDGCRDCVLHLAALSPSVVFGDSRGLVFGEYFSALHCIVLP